MQYPVHHSGYPQRLEHKPARAVTGSAPYALWIRRAERRWLVFTVNARRLGAGLGYVRGNSDLAAVVAASKITIVVLVIDWFVVAVCA